ncbi:MAG TPA: hypothetical protein VGM31_12605 [Puia sp.]
MYSGVLQLPPVFQGRYVKHLFQKHGWSNTWNGGIFTYNHYHSITHEALGFIEGATTLMLGGDQGREIRVRRGDVLVIPAGVAHKNLEDEHQVTCIGAYPDGRDYDILTGQPGERPTADHNIAEVPLPTRDPLFGPYQGICRIWHKFEHA